MIDGMPVDTAEGRCSTEACALTREWTLSSLEKAVGKHTVVAKATDRYGYWTSRTTNIEIQRDETKPSLQVSGELANAPSGWVEQEAYSLNATASDPKGYGVTSLAFKIDGAVVVSSGAACPDGACEASIAKPVDMSYYEGGAR